MTSQLQHNKKRTKKVEKEENQRRLEYHTSTVYVKYCTLGVNR